MHIIIVGCGRVGSELANSFSLEDHDVVVVDVNKGAFESLGNAFNGIAVLGTGIDTDILIKAGAPKADAIAAVTNNDNVNIMVGQLAREVFNIPRITARINHPHSQGLFHEFSLAGVCPTTLGANYIKAEILARNVHVLEVIGAGELLTVELVVGQNLIGKKLSEFAETQKIKVFAVKEKNIYRIPNQEYVCQEGDILMACVRRDALPYIQECCRQH